MARYPTLPQNMSTEDIRKMYTDIQRWGSILINELNNRDIVVDSKPSSNIYTVVTITSIGRPRKGDIAYSASTGKFKGYVSLGSETSWQNLVVPPNMYTAQQKLQPMPTTQQTYDSYNNLNKTPSNYMTPRKKT